MKYLIFFFLNIITISGLNAQNCKYKTNDLDKFTKKYTKITKPETTKNMSTPRNPDLNPAISA